jgi:hypothetical protein
MQPGLPKIPPSRINKKQVMAHLTPDLVDAAHIKCIRDSLSLQELIAEAVNAAIASYGTKPFLKVARERLVVRKKSPAKVQKLDNSVRDGKRRIGAWFERVDVERIKEECRMKGIKIEALIDKGLRIVLKDELPVVEVKDTTTAAPEQAKRKGNWDWANSQADLPPPVAKAPRKAREVNAA